MVLDLCYFSLEFLLNFGLIVFFLLLFFINRTPFSLLKWKTPYHRLYGKSPDYSMMRSFGCLCFASTLSSQRTKFEPRAISTVFIGYRAGMQGNRL